jgi:adenylate cyclase
MPTLVRSQPAPALRRRVTLAVLLATVFGSLVAVAVGLVLYLSVSSNFANTFSLLNRRTLEMIASLETAIRDDEAGVERSLRGVAALIGGIAPTDAAAIDAAMRALLVAAPDVDGLLVLDRQGELVSGNLHAAGSDIVALSPGGPEREAFAKIAEAAKAAAPGAIAWANPVRIGELTALPAMLTAGDRIAVALASARSLGRVVGRNAANGDLTVFVLDDAEDRVIAHSRHSREFEADQVPLLAEYPDPVLRLLKGARPSERFAEASAQGVSVRISDGRRGYVFVTKSLSDVGGVPIRIGAYFAKAQIGEEILAATMSLVSGLAALLAAVALAVVLGRQIARPLSGIAGAASALSDFRLEGLGELPPSRIREIDEQAAAFNNLRHALGEFARYVPRQFVARLMRSGDEAKRPVERELTIMFTDIAGFTSMSERLGAQASAALLNRHFSILTREIEATGGTVDKFMGDGLMAFWGAPEADSDHAANAVAAARAIARAAAAENADRAAQGLAAVRLRVGVHTGRVIVGNIGGGERVNYTIVGDAVNVAQRLEQLGRESMTQGDAIAVNISNATARLAGANAGLTAPRSHTLPGRDRPVGVCGLVELEGNAAPANVARTG